MQPIADFRLPIGDLRKFAFQKTVAKPNRQSAIRNRQYTEEMSHDYIR